MNPWTRGQKLARPDLITGVTAKCGAERGIGSSANGNGPFAYPRGTDGASRLLTCPVQKTQIRQIADLGAKPVRTLEESTDYFMTSGQANILKQDTSSANHLEKGHESVALKLIRGRDVQDDICNASIP